MEKVIVRADRAGVFYGEIKKRNGSEVTMTNVRRLWYWSGACSISQLAVDGTSEPDECKFTVTVPEMTILGVIEIIPCTEKAIKSIEGVAEWKKYMSEEITNEFDNMVFKQYGTAKEVKGPDMVPGMVFNICYGDEDNCFKAIFISGCQSDKFKNSTRTEFTSLAGYSNHEEVQVGYSAGLFQDEVFEVVGVMTDKL